MEYEIQNLMKLKNLERTLSDLLEKIDKEIIQTDVEWLHLKNISEANISTSEYAYRPKTSMDVKVPLPNIVLGNIKKEVSDDAAINSITLNLSSFEESRFTRETDEEFDSD